MAEWAAVKASTNIHWSLAVFLPYIPVTPDLLSKLADWVRVFKHYIS